MEKKRRLGRADFTIVTLSPHTPSEVLAARLQLKKQETPKKEHTLLLTLELDCKKNIRKFRCRGKIQKYNAHRLRIGNF